MGFYSACSHSSQCYSVSIFQSSRCKDLFVTRIVMGFPFLSWVNPCVGLDGDEVWKAVRNNSRFCGAMATTFLEKKPVHTYRANAVFSSCSFHFNFRGYFSSASWIGGVSKSSFKRYVVSNSWSGSMGWNVAKRTLARKKKRLFSSVGG